MQTFDRGRGPWASWILLLALACGSPAGAAERVASVSTDRTLKLWCLKSNKCTHSLDTKARRSEASTAPQMANIFQIIVYFHHAHTSDFRIECPPCFAVFRENCDSVASAHASCFHAFSSTLL